MISFAPIWAIVLRHMRMWRKDLNYILGAFYWPFLDILIWGFLGAWIQQTQVGTTHNYELLALLGVLLWQVVGRGCNTILFAFNEELWSNNIVNLCSLPLRIVEWICGIIVFHMLMMGLITLSSIITIFALYQIPIWSMIATFFLFAPPLFFSSIWLGFTALQIIVTFGKRSVEIGYVLVWFFMPFSGAYYPIEVLPAWGQKISSLLPMSYVFTGMRQYVMHQQNPTSYLLKGYLLSILYAASAVTLFVYCFNRSKRNGLARLVD